MAPGAKSIRVSRRAVPGSVIQLDHGLESVLRRYLYSVTSLLGPGSSQVTSIAPFIDEMDTAGGLGVSIGSAEADSAAPFADAGPDVKIVTNTIAAAAAANILRHRRPLPMLN